MTNYCLKEDGFAAVSVENLILHMSWNELQNYKCTYCLGPIARLQFGTCPCHSEAAAHPHSPIIIAHIWTYHIYLWSIKVPAELNHTMQDLFICTPRRGGSTEPALPTARRKLRLVREKEKRNSPGIHLCSQLNHCPRVGPAISGSLCIQLIHAKAQKSQGSSRGTWTQGTKPFLFSGSMF